jgi:LruC domain-containing protein
MERRTFASILGLAAGSLLSAAAPARAQDADADGVADAADAFPCDAARASVSFFPGQSTSALFAFEDQWPGPTDLDFNDVAVRVHYRLERDAAGGVASLLAIFDPVALGGDFSSGLGLQLPASREGVTARRRVGGGEWQAVALEADASATMLLSPNLRELYDGAPGRINSRPGEARQRGQRLELELTFAAPAALSQAAAPFDVFIFRSDDPGHQIHLPQYAGTAAMRTALFNSGHDASSATRRFVHRSGVPAALNLMTTTRYPLEGVSIGELFPGIARFAASGGASDAAFYSSDVVAARGHEVPADAIEAPGAASTDCVARVGAGPLSAAILADAPSGYWPLDDADGAAARDASGNGRHGSYRGTVRRQQPGPAGAAVALDGAGWVSTPVALSTLMPSTQGTVTAIVRIPERLQDSSSLGYPGTMPQAIWSSWAYFQGVTAGRFGGVSGLHFWSFYTGSDDRRVSVQAQRGDWLHVAWVMRDGRLRAYVNGVEVSVAATEAMAGMGTFVIGRNDQLNGTFAGSLQHVATFPVGLSAERVRAHAAAAGLLAPATAPLSCSAIRAADPSAPSGYYDIDADGDLEGSAPPFRVYCEMTLDGGGWELVFLQDETANLHTTTRGYDLDVFRQRANASEALLGYLGADGRPTGNFARFPVPPSWRGRSPLAQPGTDVVVRTAVNGEDVGDRTLRFGTGSFNARCEDGWTSTWGRVCIRDTAAPFFSGFAASDPEFCAHSQELYSAAACAASSRRFFIALRARADLVAQPVISDGVTQGSAGRSCADLAARGHDRGDGLYWLDPDGGDTTNAFQATCLMGADGGGWTLVYQHRPSASLASSSIGYDLVDAALMAEARHALIGYRTAAGAVTGRVARFPLPADWLARNPLSAPPTDVWVETHVDGVAQGSRLLRYGTGSFSTRCEDPWTGTWGRLCIQSTRAPFFSSFAHSYAETCAYSDEAWNAATCSATDRGFFIAVR